MVPNAVNVKNIYKSFTTKSGINNDRKHLKKSEKITKKVIDDISFNIKKGEVFGIIGRNGSGKSTILKMISMIMKPDSGTIDIDGRVASILELGMGFHQDLSGRENIYVKGAMYGFSKEQIDDRIENIVKYADLGDYIDLPIRVYSSGMTGRLAFALMINVDADIMILDEILSTGDLAFGKKSGTHFSNVKSQGKTIIIVAHNMSVMRDMCDRVAWIDGGKIREIGPPNVVCGHYETELAESFEIIKELAESGVPDSQNKLGCMYRDGHNVEKNLDIAINWFEEAAKRDNDVAKINLADILMAGGKSEERDKILDLYMSAARRGNREARIKLSRLLTQKTLDIGDEVVNDFKKLLPSENPSLYADYADLLMKTAWDNECKKEALVWFQRSAESGNANAMYQIALMYRDGNGPKPDNAKHVEWLTKAAENGHVPSQLFLGNMYRDGIKVECDETEAFRWYKTAADNNNLDAIYQVSIMYREGKGVEKDICESERWLSMYSRHGLFRQINILADSFSHCKNGVYNPEIGLKWYSINAEHNNADSKYQMGVMLRDGEEAEKNIFAMIALFDSAAKNGHMISAIQLSNLYGIGIADEVAFEKSIGIMEDLARKGNVWAANAIGGMYINGNVVNIDAKKAVKYLKIAASSNLPGALQKLGEIYRDGIFIEQDFDEAIRWFEEGIIAGNIWSATSLINMYCAGNVEKRIFDKAFKSLENMCIAGNITAMKILGKYYLNGIAVEADPKKAFYWYTIASKFGDVESKNILGEMYRDGKGVEKDISKALKLYISSAEQGFVYSMLAIIKMHDSNQADGKIFDFAFKRLEQIANGGNIIAIRTLGTMYFEGLSISKDLVKAKQWFEKSAVLGDIFSYKKLKLII